MRLTLTDNEGEIICWWSIGDKIEFDPEDLEAEPEHDFYIEGDYTFPSEIGESVWNEIIKAHMKGVK